MKIAILGTRGIPNNYGGFEQFAEYLSVGLAALGHKVTVYNPRFHPYKEATFKGVNIQRIFSPENFIGSAANFIYDHLCLKDAIHKEFDIIYEAGYHSVALSYWVLGVNKFTNPVLITNMDGLEWKRDKWNFLVKRLIRWLERIAVNYSHFLVSDNVGIQNYYASAFNKDSFYLPYGAIIPSEFDEASLQKYGVVQNQYFILVARLEPENNIELIIQGFCLSSATKKLVIVGNVNSYGRRLQKRYLDDRLLFVGGVYNKTDLDSLRYFSFGYFHGHSVGGTNPSLLEAMASACFIMAHDNPFNRAILDESSFYFSSATGVMEWVNSSEYIPSRISEQFKKDNLEKVRKLYTWEKIIHDHEALFQKLLNIK